MSDLSPETIAEARDHVAKCLATLPEGFPDEYEFSVFNGGGFTIADLRALLSAAEGWQPIDTAPKDGHRLLLSGNNRGVRWVAIGHYAPYAGCTWQVDYPGELHGVDHWRQLPSPPQVKP